MEFTSTTTRKNIAICRKDSLASKKNNEIDVLFVINGKSGHPIEDLIAIRRSDQRVSESARSAV